ncbi:M4 family metallopeptidase [Actinocorallia longicatena]|uniref:M4 family metallopeptidase n=1 Tax=Actinocorallia longicatena TaxID=111803 RepID=A0ABP6Q780_9ACTN
MKHPTVTGALAIAAGLIVAITTPALGASAPSAPTPPEPRAQAAAAADRLVSTKPARLRVSGKDRIARKDVVSGAGGLQYVSYERTYAGLPVYGGDFVVTTNATGGVLGTSVSQAAPLSVATTPKVQASAAVQTSRDQLTRVDEASEARLTVLAEGTGRLVYETVVSGAKGTRPSKLHVFVDAAGGQVAGTWDEVQDAADDVSYYHGTVDLSTQATSMADPARSGIRCGGQNGSTYTGTDSAWGNGSGTNLETACVDVLYAVQTEWNMLGAWLGRSGINGSGSGFPARVGLADVNAYWNGSYTNFGHNQANTRQATSVDVVAHEFGHAIFQTTPGGSSGGSGNEKGGMNESAGDIFGALTEHYANEPAALDPPDYLVGEEVDLVGGGPIRNMYNPSAVGDPNCYTSSIPSTEVHAAAGPQNHWFYLLAEGSNPGGGKPSSPTCNGTTVTGIGIQKAGAIFQGGLNRKVTAWSHARARIETVNAANALYPGSATECNAVKAAWAAVSVPAQSGEAACGGSQQNDFSLTLSPASGSAQAGGSATATVTTQVTGGSAQSVALSATSSPAGPTASFSPASITSGQTSAMTVNVPAGTASGTYTLTVTADGATVDRTATYTLTVGTAPPGCPPFTNATAQNIPDLTTINSTIAVTGCSGNASATSTVAVDIDHTYKGDLSIDLIAPDGTSYNLKANGSGGSTDNVKQTFTVNLSSETANGTWTLRVRDNASIDTGRLNTWTIDL